MLYLLTIYFLEIYIQVHIENRNWLLQRLEFATFLGVIAQINKIITNTNSSDTYRRCCYIYIECVIKLKQFT